tara:strand:+ start:3258 stop:3998 length:741 start_codon:yes stop_codon:yes gene_type:complete
MKKSLLITSIALILGMTSKAQVAVVCPTDIQVTSSFVTLTYSPSIPNGGVIDQVKFQLISGTWKTLSLDSQTSTTITFNNQTANLASTDVVTSIRLFRSGQAVARCTTQQTLPVDLTSFKAVRIEDNVRLEWTTASELNNDYFEVLKSYDGEAFFIVGYVDGHGTSSKVIDYSYTDSEPRQAYYRLKQLDYDGQFEYSDVVAAKGNRREVISIRYYTFAGVETQANQGGLVVTKYTDGSYTKTMVR